MVAYALEGSARNSLTCKMGLVYCPFGVQQRLNYIGRFAPSPTGPLHFGSLLAATASYLDARANGGQWLVRMEDVDTARLQPGAATEILGTLERIGFEWDGQVLVQTSRTAAYQAAFDSLREKGHVYACGCTRKEIADSSVDGPAGLRYPGTCRKGLPPGKTARAWRLRVESDPISFQDRVQGWQTQDVEDYS